MSRTIDFYKGRIRHPRGVSIETIWRWSPEQLESEHTYIQWLFPLPERSGAVPSSPLLTSEDIEDFKRDPELQASLRKSFVTMLTFYGFTLKMIGESSIGLVVEPSSGFEDRSKLWLTFGNHNYLRLTRILKSLMLLGLEAEAKEFFASLQHVYLRNAKTIGSLSYSYWKGAVEGITSPGTTVKSLQNVQKQLLIPREKAIILGRETLKILQEGRYRAANGHQVGLKQKLDNCLRRTVSYPPDNILPSLDVGSFSTTIEVSNETTLSAARRLLSDGHASVALNMANPTQPGGGFLSGARAQEEYLCRSSGLFACLRGNPMYAFHSSCNDPFWSDFTIYSRDVPILRDDNGILLEDVWSCSFISCAAVQAMEIARYLPLRKGEIPAVMRRRIARMLSIASVQQHQSIVLGAWGCGAFGNDGDVIAGLFDSVIRQEMRGVFQRIIFAITDWSDDRTFIGPFERRFKA